MYDPKPHFSLAKAGFNQVLTRLHSIAGLKKVLHRSERKPHGLELKVVYSIKSKVKNNKFQDQPLIII